MKRRSLTIILLVISLGSPCKASPDDELSLFDSTGKTIAYIGEAMTVYLWSGKPLAYLTEDREAQGAGAAMSAANGKPLAYLTEDREGGFHIYGFNGKHLGWFVKGIVRDHRGSAVGGIEEVFSSPTKPQPLKGLRELTPLKSLTELAPLRPLFTRNWSDIPLKLFLLAGEE